LSEYPPASLRILVAEPSRTLAALIRASLAELPVELELCADGASALQAARMRTPDVLICDEKLGGLDGYALAHAMKQLGGDKRVMTLLMVPEHGQPDPERLAYVGVADVLAKPFERAVLLERVRALLPQPPRLSHREATREPHREPHVETGRWHTDPNSQPSYGYHQPPEWPRSPGPQTQERLRPAVEPMVRAPLGELAPGAASQLAEVKRLAETLERRLADLDQHIETRVEQKVEARLSQALATRLPTMVDGALQRLMPSMVSQAVERAVERAVSDRVPAAVAAVVDEARHTLNGLASSEEVERLVRSLAQDTVATVLGKEVLTLVPQALAEVRAHIESELLNRLDRFAKTELPQKLVAHAEQIVWKVVPSIAEDLVREELKRLTAD